MGRRVYRRVAAADSLAGRKAKSRKLDKQAEDNIRTLAGLRGEESIAASSTSEVDSEVWAGAGSPI
jgi:hypothetical protein